MLEIQYERLYEFERELLTLDGAAQRIALRQQIKRDLIPVLRRYEQEYADLLAAGAQDDSIPEDQAKVVVAELIQATSRTEQNSSGVPHEMLQLLHQIKEKLDEPGKSATAKLKVALPIVPMIASYELEVDTENLFTNTWRKARSLFEQWV